MEEVSRWLKAANLDYEVSRHLFEYYYPKPLEIICYHCQQSAEKATKAVILSIGLPGGLPKTHDISFLLSQMKNYVSVDEKFYDYADVLNVYATQARYPNELELEESNAAKALEYANELLRWSEKAIESKNQKI